jgi:hypothetical protein
VACRSILTSRPFTRLAEQDYPHQERPMILRQFLHTDPVIAASYVFG